jgi:hypothetical protein
VRLNRNRNLITGRENNRGLAQLGVGVVGSASATPSPHIVAQQGIVRQLRLATSTSWNCPTSTASRHGVRHGFNKATTGRKAIAELDPYLPVEFRPRHRRGLRRSIPRGCDILVEECDSLDAKVLVRQAARARRIPVLMATA